MKPFRHSQRHPGAFTISELLVAVAVIAILLALCLPVLSMVRERGKETGCQMNLRLVASYVYLYAGDNAGYFPPGWDPVERRAWPSYLSPYAGEAVQNIKISGKKVYTGPFYCPSSSMDGKGIYERDQAQWRTDFGANGDLFSYPPAKAGSQGAFSPQMVMLYDGTGVKKNPPAEVKKRARHGGRSNIVFLDGHIQSHKEFPTAPIHWKGTP